METKLNVNDIVQIRNIIDVCSKRGAFQAAEMELVGGLYNKIKAWHLHKLTTLNYVCIKGKVKFVLFDNRNNSPTKGVTQEIIMSPEKYFLVTIPNNIWNGFKGLDKEESIIANCLNFPHNEDEMVRIDPLDKSIGYDWN